jgi:hypothetical protein
MEQQQTPSPGEHIDEPPKVTDAGEGSQKNIDRIESDI